MSIKGVIAQYILATLFAIVIIPIVELFDFLIPDLGWHFLTVFYYSILILLISFYYLTSKLNVILSILSFILNFILWVAENVNLEKTFSESAFYKEYHYGVMILGGFLWATNKLLIEFLLSKNKKVIIRSNKLEQYL